jgi:hypothetical protein
MAVREGRWDCPSCGAAAQMGRDVACGGCGSPRPKGVRFYLPEDAPEVTDAARLAEARAGADWVCEHCGASSRATLADCAGCGAPRGSSPQQAVHEYGEDEIPRSGGRSTPRPLPVAAVPPKRKSRKGKVFAGVLAAGIGAMMWGNRTRQVEAEIVAKQWERTVQVEEYRTVTESDWALPSGGTLVRQFRDVREYRQVLDHHETRTRQVSDRVQTGTERRVCGSRDNGNGYFEDVYCSEPVYETRYRTETYQEPVYRREPVYATKYEYRIKRWLPDTLLAARGDTTAPVWPTTRLDGDQREGPKKQAYVLTFRDSEGETYTDTVDISQFSGHRIGQPVRLRVKGGEVEIDTATAKAN